MTTPTAEEIGALENERYAAMLAADVDTLDRLLSTDLSYVHSSSARDSKTSYLEKVASGHFSYKSVEHPIEKIVTRPGLAVVTGIMRGEVHVAGVPKQLNCSALAVWAAEADHWLLLAYQPTSIPG